MKYLVNCSFNCIGIILAGGEGKRLKSLTADTPKVLLKYKEKRIIDYPIEFLRNGGVYNITIAVAYLNEIISKTMGTKFSYFKSESDDNIFYVIMSLIRQFDQNLVGIFLDGDSVIQSGDLSKIICLFKENWNQLDAIIIRTGKTNVPSQWDFHISEKNIVTDVFRNKESKLSKVLTIIKLKSLVEIIEKKLRYYNIEAYRKEDQFLPNYEEYLLGWGLIYKLLIENGSKISCLNEEINYINVNHPKDLQ